MKLPRSGGGWQAIRYTFRKAREVGYLRLFRAMRTKNACKTCALGMGGQQGGMRNEHGHFPEFCKKSLQAMAADMQGRIEEKFLREYSVERMKAFSPREMEMMGRLAKPVLKAAGESHYREISWEDATEKIASKLRAADPRRVFFYSSGRSSNEAGFLLQLFARVYGTNHVNNCSYYCHQASGAGLSDSIGTGTATVSLEDVEQSDCLFLIGGNPASNHPRLMTTLMNLRRRGGQVIVINPMKEVGLVNFRVPSDPRSFLFGSEIASLYVQPRIGGDIALMSGVAKALLERNAIDPVFISDVTDGFDPFSAHVGTLTWPEIERASGVSRTEIEHVADAYARSSKAIFAWTMGITHHEYGVANVQWIVNLALLRGMLGKPGAGLLPIRGHSNVQGLGSLGVTPALRKAVFDGIEAMGVKVPDFAGYDTMACMEAAHRGELDFGLCLGGNLYGSNPDSAFASRALANLDLLVYLSTTLNTGHAHGVARETLILPVLARDEEAQSTTQESMFNYVRLSDGGKPRHDGPRSESAVLASIASRTLGHRSPIDFSKLENHVHVRDLIARIVPGFERLADIDQTKQEFQIAGRVFHQPRFPTPDGKARFRPHPIPEQSGLADDELRLMTVRSEGQFNTVVYEEEDLYRGQDRRDVVLMSPADMKRLGLAPDDRVTVTNATGRMTDLLARPFDVAPGSAVMYYPEANVLVPRVLDPLSKTPAFKSVIVNISKTTAPTSRLTVLADA